MSVPETYLRDRRLWTNCAAHIRTRAGVLHGEAIFDPVPGPGLLAHELAKVMPRWTFLVAGPVPPRASPNLRSAGASWEEAVLPEQGVGLLTCAFTLDDWPRAKLEAMLARLEKEIVRTGRLIILTRLASPKAPNAPTAFADAVEDGLLHDLGFERVRVEELDYLADGAKLAIVQARRPAADAPAEEE